MRLRTNRITMKRLFELLRGKRKTADSKIGIPERVNAGITSSDGKKTLIGD